MQFVHVWVRLTPAVHVQSAACFWLDKMFVPLCLSSPPVSATPYRLPFPLRHHSSRSSFSDNNSCCRIKLQSAAFPKKRRKCLIIFPPLQVALVAVPTVLGIASIRVYTVREAPADGLVSRDRVRLAVPQHHLEAVSLAVLCLNSPCLSSWTSTPRCSALARLRSFQKVQDLLREG